MNQLHIQINREIINRYKKEGLSIEFMGSVLFILFSLYEQAFDLLDFIDDGNKEKRVLMLYHYLHRKQFLEPCDEYSDVNYQLTERAVDFVKFCKSFQVSDSALEQVVPASESSLPGPLTSSPEVSKDVSDWIEEWINIFPKGKYDGRYLRTDKHECSDRMRWFMKNYNFDKELIFRATRAYIEAQEQSSTGHTYTKNSSYFIFKGRSKMDRTSGLATWCQVVLDNKEADRDYIERDVT